MPPADMIIRMHIQFGLIFCYIITYSVHVTSVCCEQETLAYSTYWACPKHNSKPVHVVSMEKQQNFRYCMKGNSILNLPKLSTM